MYAKWLIQASLQALQSVKAQVPDKYVYMAYAHLYILIISKSLIQYIDITAILYCVGIGNEEKGLAMLSTFKNLVFPSADS